MPFPIRYNAPPEPAPMPSAPAPAWQGAMSQVPAVSAPAPPPVAPPRGTGGPGAGAQLLQMLPALLGGMSSRGGPAFMRGMQRARQEQAQQQQLAGQAEDRQFSRDVRQQELEMAQADAQQKAQLAKVNAYQTVMKRLEDPALDTPEAYDSAEREMIAWASLLGVDPGAIVAGRPRLRSTNRFEKAAAAKVLKRAENYTGTAAAQLANADPIFEEGGQKKPLSEWRRIAGQPRPTTADGKAWTPTATVDVPNTPEEQFYQQFAKENGAPSFQSLSTKQQAAARKQWMQSDDRLLAGGGGGMSDPRINARVDRMVGSFNAHPIVKEYIETQNQQSIIRDLVAGQWSGPGDMAVVFAFMKALDPTSVVREAEYDNAAKSGNIFAGWAARFNGGLNPSGGFLSEQVRKDFLKTINARMSIKGRQYNNLRSEYAARVDRIRSGAPETGDEALVDYAAGGSEGGGEGAIRYDMNGKVVP